MSPRSISAARELAQHELGGGQRLVLLARRHRHPVVGRHAVERRHVLVGDREPPAVGGPEEGGLQQAAAEEDRVVARLGGGPDQPGASRGAGARACSAGTAWRTAARAGGRHGHLRRGLVHRQAVLVQLVEAPAVAGQRPALARRAAPGVLGVDLQVDDGVPAERVAHPLRAQRPAAEGDHPGVVAAEQLAAPPPPRAAGTSTRPRGRSTARAARRARAPARGRSPAPRRPARRPRYGRRWSCPRP